MENLKKIIEKLDSLNFICLDKYGCAEVAYKDMEFILRVIYKDKLAVRRKNNNYNVKEHRIASDCMNENKIARKSYTFSKLNEKRLIDAIEYEYKYSLACEKARKEIEKDKKINFDNAMIDLKEIAELLGTEVIYNENPNYANYYTIKEPLKSSLLFRYRLELKVYKDDIDGAYQIKEYLNLIKEIFIRTKK